jgi:hypothetical protein
LSHHEIRDIGSRDVTALGRNAIDGSPVLPSPRTIGQWQGAHGDPLWCMVLDFLQCPPMISQSVTDQAFGKKQERCSPKILCRLT